jgi:hypothetical protein
LPAHGRPAWLFGLYVLSSKSFERSGEQHYRKRDARLKIRRTVGSSRLPDSQKVCNVQIWHAHFVNGMFQWTATFKAHFLDQPQSIKVPSHYVFLVIIEEPSR